MCTAGRLLKALKKIGKRFIRGTAYIQYTLQHVVDTIFDDLESGTTSSVAATLAKRGGLHKRSW